MRRHRVSRILTISPHLPRTGGDGKLLRGRRKTRLRKRLQSGLVATAMTMAIVPRMRSRAEIRKAWISRRARLKCGKLRHSVLKSGTSLHRARKPVPRSRREIASKGTVKAKATGMAMVMEARTTGTMIKLLRISAKPVQHV